ncbi:hypothetical protein FOA52_001411 [Chlamydomonas sp. UWO 241]|nr:hypothetical protein FOA52_001411 [Chlamydomonas sp. UWO 241]
MVRGGVSKVYAVRKGRRVGLFSTWDEVKEMVTGFPGAQHKSFLTAQDAEMWLAEGGVPQQGGQRPASHYDGCGDAGAAGTSGGGDGAYSPPPEKKKRGRPVGSRNGGGRGAGRGNGQHLNLDNQHDDSKAGAAPTFDAADAASAARSQGIVGELRRGVEAACSALLRSCPGVADPSKEYTMAFDGGSRGNPGSAGGAAVITESRSGREVVCLTAELPYGSTSNEAEYSGLLIGLLGSLYLGSTRLRMFGDSELIIFQVQGKCTCRKPNLTTNIPLYPYSPE